MSEKQNSAEDTAVNQTDKNPYPGRLYIPVGEAWCKQTR
jgi:hypothetical protein